jgi:arginyl-tRNA synthetase
MKDKTFILHPYPSSFIPLILHPSHPSSFILHPSSLILHPSSFLVTPLANLQARFRHALAAFTDEPSPWLEMIRRAQDARFGDYQANLAMPLGKQLNKKPQELAAEIVATLDVGDFLEPPEVAGPGFINLRLKDDWLVWQLTAAVNDPRLGVEAAAVPRTCVIDFSGPNVAKPMHVGHIRSTVIGDALCRTLRFLGHRVIGDNHIGDWGTQFGMIIYGYKHFLDADAYRNRPVEELARLYRLVRQLVDYFEAKESLPELQMELEKKRQTLAAQREAAVPAAGQKVDKKRREGLQKLENSIKEAAEEIEGAQKKITAIESDTVLSKLAAEHPRIGAGVLAETARLHADDAENIRLWKEFMPYCLEDIERIYRRLNVRFDHTFGESHYHDMLPGVVEELRRRGIARDSQGALCIFLEGYPAPMIVQKQDGAYLYATTDLATIRYRMDEWRPDTMLYVVDHRQAMHFQQLFAAARLLGYEQVEMQHVGFGTVLGKDGRPFKTRAGDTVGLEGLLDEAVLRAARIVAENDDAKPGGPELSRQQRACVATTVGIGALKYADLSQNRTSDYEFDYEKMLAMNGNTATYMQYAYARVRSIFVKGGVDIERLRGAGAAITLGTPAERALALELLRFGDALALAMTDYRPNQITGYLFDLAKCFSAFFENCPVLKAETPELRDSRLLLCDLTARTIRQGLDLLGIGVEEKM